MNSERTEYRSERLKKAMKELFQDESPWMATAANAGARKEKTGCFRLEGEVRVRKTALNKKKRFSG